jgi:hypothetical protein
MLKIYADGSISCGTTRLSSRINGTSPRELTVDSTGEQIDVTHVWHLPGLEGVVSALLAGAELPTGFHARSRRRDNMRMIWADCPARGGSLDNQED